jgi:nicotinamide riboside kinase
MFRFSIRELMLVTLAVAMGVGWFADHRRLREGHFRQRVNFHAELVQELERHGLHMGYQAHSNGSPPSPILYRPSWADEPSIP